MNDEQERLRQQRLVEIKKRYEEKQREVEAESKLNQVVRALLSEEAKARLNNVKLVNRELYLKAVQAIIYLHESGKIAAKLSEEQLRQLLEALRNKREIKIKRK